MFNLKGHTALVTGSTKGIGRAIAESCAQAGAHVLVHGRKDSDEAQRVVDRCRSFGVHAAFVATDLAASTESAVAQLFATVIDAMPDVDLLINNAGQYFDQPFFEMTLERFERTLRLNVSSAYFLTQKFALRWSQRSVRGRVLFIGSINGILAEPVSTAYDISKGALEMMVRTLSVTLAPHKIRVNGLAPGLVRTPQTMSLDQQPQRAAWLAHHTPNGQIPDAKVCGPGAVYLLSDAAEHVHGHMLRVDGGMAAWQHPEPDPWIRAPDIEA